MAIKARIKRLENYLLPPDYGDQVEVWAQLFMEARVFTNGEASEIPYQYREDSKWFLKCCYRSGQIPSIAVMNRIASRVISGFDDSVGY